MLAILVDIIPQVYMLLKYSLQTIFQVYVFIILRILISHY